MPVEPNRGGVDGVNNHGDRGDLRGLGERPVQSVHEQEFAKALPCVPPVDGKSSQQRRPMPPWVENRWTP